MRAAFSNALYYPYIDIQNSEWLKTAILFWDSVSTIVPASVRQPYEYQDSQYLADVGFLTPIHVDSRDESVVGIENEAIGFVESEEFFNFAISTTIGEFSIHQDKMSMLLQERMLRELSEIGIYPEKLSREFRHYLGDRFRFLGHRFGASNGYHFEPAFVNFYMTLLANKICENHSLALVTDSMASNKLSNTVRFGTRNSIQSRRSNINPYKFEQGLLLDLVINDLRISPDNDIEAIIKFKSKHKDELGLFRTNLAKLTQGISQDQPLDAIRQEVNDVYINEFLPTYNNFKSALTGSGIKWLSDNLLSVSTLSVSTTGVSIAAAGMTVPYALLAGAGISLLASTVKYSIDKRNAIRENPYSYLLAVEKEW